MGHLSHYFYYHFYFNDFNFGKANAGPITFLDVMEEEEEKEVEESVQKR